ncbi:hypothetical protein ORR20_003550 [Escherichia coli]|nr:hypothetical protein [Escherichia coli]EKD4633302.1 hypothetical protein [Escherichia coli]HDH7750036.1 hypothetical protein [Escherichia coli]
MKSPTLEKNQKVFGPFNKNFGGVKFVKTINGITAAIFACFLICNESMAESARFPGAEHSSEFGDITRTYLHHVELPFSGKVNFLHQFDREWICDCVEFLTSVPVHCQPMTDTDTKPKGNHGPYERNEGGISIEQGNKFTPDSIHGSRRLLLVLLGGAVIVFPSGVYFGVKAACGHDYARRRYTGKAPVLGVLSVLVIPKKVKCRRWQIWEQRQWFHDMNLGHGIEIAYQDTRNWKKLVAERWY